jgi:hypothetical protein
MKLNSLNNVTPSILFRAKPVIKKVIAGPVVLVIMDNTNIFKMLMLTKSVVKRMINEETNPKIIISITLISVNS